MFDSYLSRLFTLNLTSLCSPALKWTLLFTLYKVAQSPQSANLNFGPHKYRETPPKTNINKLKQGGTWFKRCLPVRDPFNHSGTSTASFPNLLGEIYFPTSAPPAPPTPLRLPLPCRAGMMHGSALPPWWGGNSGYCIGPWVRDDDGCISLRMTREHERCSNFQIYSHVYGRGVCQCGEHTSNSFALQMFGSY